MIADWLDMMAWAKVNWPQNYWMIVICLGLAAVCLVVMIVMLVWSVKLSLDIRRIERG